MPLRVVRLRLIEQGLLNDVTGAASSRQVARDATAPRRDRTPVPVVTPRRARRPEGRRTADAGRARAADAGVLRGPGLPARARPRRRRDEPAPRDGTRVAGVAGGRDAFNEIDLRIAKAAGALLGRGVDGRFLGALRRVVEREVGVIEDLTEPLRSRARRATPEQTRAEVAAVSDEVEALRAAAARARAGELPRALTGQSRGPGSRLVSW